MSNMSLKTKLLEARETDRESESNEAKERDIETEKEME